MTTIHGRRAVITFGNLSWCTATFWYRKLPGHMQQMGLDKAQQNGL